jgi:hypothetical protein
MKSNSMSYATAAVASLAVLVAFVFSGRSHLPAAFGQAAATTGFTCSAAVGFGGCYSCAKKELESPTGAGCQTPTLPTGGTWGLCETDTYGTGCASGQQWHACGQMRRCSTDAPIGQCSTIPWCV